MKKQVDVVMLPTEKATNIIQCHNSKLWYNDTRYLKSYQHLYFLSDEEIKEENWVFDVFAWKRGKGDVVIRNVNLTQGQLQFCKKIITTTDECLVIKHNCNCFATTYEGCSECLGLLPRPSNEFLEKFCELGGIDKVLVEYEMAFTGYEGTTGFENWDKRLKIAPDNTITIYPI